jgi:hypothetical protein
MEMMDTLTPEQRIEILQQRDRDNRAALDRVVGDIAFWRNLARKWRYRFFANSDTGFLVMSATVGWLAAFGWWAAWWCK